MNDQSPRVQPPPTTRPTGEGWRGRRPRTRSGRPPAASRPWLRPLSALLGGLFVLGTAAAAFSGVFGPGPNSTVVPSTQQNLSVVITSPADNTQIPFNPGTVTVTGNCAIGSVPGQPINILYILDVSGSTDRNTMINSGTAYVDANGNGIGSFASPDPGDDYNGDGEAGETLDGEISGVLALNGSIGNPANVRVGVEAFALAASAADVGPGAGFQYSATPPQVDANSAGGPDVDQVLRSLRSEATASPVYNSIGLFTAVTSSTIGINTNFSAALTTMNGTLSNFPAGPATNIVFFLSDGESNSGGRCYQSPYPCNAQLNAAVAAGTVINTVGVGLSADPTDLQYIATYTGGTFTQVDDPSDLSTILPSLTPEGLDHVVVDGMTVALDPIGNFSKQIQCTDLNPFTVTATCYADDPQATNVSADIMLQCYGACGDGTVDPGEQCDDGNTADGDCCSSTCTIEPSSTVCRASAGECDAAETCDGTTPACPTDAFAPSSTTCRAANGECDAAETCTGSTATCPADLPAPDGTACTDDGNACTADRCAAGQCGHPAGHAGTVCRPANGDCDVAEVCDGTDTACPAEAFQPASTICRAAAGACDQAEVCSGSSAGCPTDGFKPSGIPCRSPAGECDVEETCTGNGISCPTDGFEPAGTACPADASVCTLDVCSGAGAQCTHPAGNAGTECRGSGGVCDPAESCDGESTACPADEKSTAVCRPADGVCDVAEQCTGNGNDCPSDLLVPDGTPCDDGDMCSVDDQCMSGLCGGTSTTCGNGIVDCNEECDDGNTTDGDGCSSTCEDEEVCSNQDDDDGDGLIDCDDPDCPNCEPLINVCAHPCVSQILFKPKLDLLKIQGAMQPGTPYDPATEEFGLLITNANGIVYNTVLPPNTLIKRGSTMWTATVKTAKTGGGIYKLKVFLDSANAATVRFNLQAYGEVTTSATLATMSVQVRIGDDVAANTSTWTQLAKGWRANLQ